VVVVRIGVSEESVSIIAVKRNELGGTLAVTNVTANVPPSSLILFILMIEAILPSDTSVLIGTTLRHIPEYGILPTHSRENLRSYIILTGWAL
jgi:hypothetical protein